MQFHFKHQLEDFAQDPWGGWNRRLFSPISNFVRRECEPDGAGKQAAAWSFFIVRFPLQLGFPKLCGKSTERDAGHGSSQQCAICACPASPFQEYFPPKTLLTQFTTRQQGSSTMAGDTHILVSPFQAQTSDGKSDLWDFGSSIGDSNNLLFEKEVLDIQVGKGSKCFLLKRVKVQKISNLHGHGE